MLKKFKETLKYYTSIGEMTCLQFTLKHKSKTKNVGLLMEQD